MHHFSGIHCCRFLVMPAKKVSISKKKAKVNRRRNLETKPVDERVAFETNNDCEAAIEAPLDTALETAAFEDIQIPTIDFKTNDSKVITNDQKKPNHQISEQVARSVDTAIAVANDQRRQLDNKILAALKKLEELDNNNNDDLLSIDFNSLPNHFQTLETELSRFKFRLPSTWTKKYAASLLSDNNDQLHSRSSPDYQADSKVPATYSCNGNVDSSDSAEETYQSYTRQAKSLHDLTPLEKQENYSSTEQFEKNVAAASSAPNLKYQRNSKANKVNRCMEGAESRHFELINKSLDEFTDYAVAVRVNEMESTNLKSHRNLSTCLDKIEEDIEMIKKTKKFRLISDTSGSLSKNHISVGTQTTGQKSSAFTAYVELKRQLATSVQSQTTLKKLHSQLVQRRFLKDTKVPESNSCLQRGLTPQCKMLTLKRNQSSLEILNQPQLKRKFKCMNMKTYSLEQQVHHATATAPSFADSIDFPPSKAFDKNGNMRSIVVKTPSLILPVSKIFSHADSSLQKSLQDMKNNTLFRSDKSKQLMTPGLSSLHYSHYNSHSYHSYNIIADIKSNPGTEKCLGLNPVLQNAKSLLLSSCRSNMSCTSQAHSKQRCHSESVCQPSSCRVLTYHHKEAPVNFKPIVLPKRIGSYKERLVGSLEMMYVCSYRIILDTFNLFFKLLIIYKIFNW